MLLDALDGTRSESCVIDQGIEAGGRLGAPLFDAQLRAVGADDLDGPRVESTT